MKREIIRSFLSYEHARSVPEDDLIVVDCHYPRGLALTHLYSARVPVELRANTSTAVVFGWLRLADELRDDLSGQARIVTCNHWDIDGFLGIWSLLNPELALEHEPALLAAALLGDFREFDLNTSTGLEALKVCSLLNEVERSTFCLPFGDLEDATIEYQVAKQKFEFFLPRFGRWLQKIDQYQNLWEKEYSQVLDDLSAIDSGTATIAEQSQIGLSIIRTPRPLHYYAGFNRARGGIVMTILEPKPYIEIEYKYETSTGRLDRKIIARKDLSNLASRLTLMEQEPGAQWKFDNIHEGGPMLRPEFLDQPLSHEDRYQSMGQRIDRSPSTSVNPDELLVLLQDELSSGRFTPVLRTNTA